MTLKKFNNFVSENIEPENKWIIYYGLGGGFGGADGSEAFEGTKGEAETEAWNKACENYESYVGSNGIRSIEDIMEEDEVEYDDAEQTYNEERESWLDYWAAPYTKSEIEKAQHTTHFTDFN